ncbi:MAG: toll/interleukin-1 receptor domain-containing protein [Hyphomonadaceae bacterium]
MADVFISYARDNKDRVQLIARALEAEGYSVWWDSELPLHRAYADVIDEQIDAAKAVIVAWSQDARNSQWVRAEADKARNQGKLVQTSIDGVLPPLPFDQIHAADLSKWNGAASDERWRPVRDSVAELVSGRRPPARPPSARAAAQRPSPLPAILIIAVLLTMGAGAAYFMFPSLRQGEQSASPDVASPGAEIDASSAAAPEAAPPAPRLAAGEDHELVIPGGQAFDLDAGAVSERVIEGSDFILAGIGEGDWFLDQATQASGSRPDTQGAPSPALCDADEYFYRSYLADPGEYNCFRTDEGRAGALIRRRDRDGAVVITYRFWD